VRASPLSLALSLAVIACRRFAYRQPLPAPP
jgi:hypothetical protein